MLLLNFRQSFHSHNRRTYACEIQNSIILDRTLFYNCIDGFFIGCQVCESKSSEAIRDIDSNSFGGPS